MIELSVGDYGKHLFNVMMTGVDSGARHWESIRAKAEPLVKELIRLNGEMDGRVYDVIVPGKLTRSARIVAAQYKDWGYLAGDLVEGDLFFTALDDLLEVECVKAGGYVIASNSDDLLFKVDKEMRILKAPSDFQDRRDEYESDGYWLGRAKELGI